MRNIVGIVFMLAVISFTAFSETAEETVLLSQNHPLFGDREPAWISKFQTQFHSLYSASTVSAHSLTLMLRLFDGFSWSPDPAESAAAFFSILKEADSALKRGIPANRVFVEMRAELSLRAENRYRDGYSALLGGKRRDRGNGPAPNTGGVLDPPKRRKNQRRLL